MVQPIQLDEKRRLLFKKLEGSRAFLKSIIKNKSLSQNSRSFFIRKLHEKPRNSSKVRIRNRCILTGRGRGVFKEFRVSRIKFRELASQGLIPGVTKTSW
jgi:small subunit ribosomal protein S14